MLHTMKSIHMFAPSTIQCSDSCTKHYIHAPPQIPAGICLWHPVSPTFAYGAGRSSPGRPVCGVNTERHAWQPSSHSWRGCLGQHREQVGRVRPETRNQLLYACVKGSIAMYYGSVALASNLGPYSCVKQMSAAPAAFILSRTCTFTDSYTMSLTLTYRKPGAFNGVRLLPSDALERVEAELCRTLADMILSDPPYKLRWLREHPHKACYK